MRFLLVLILTPLNSSGQQWFVGGFGGISTLSGDARSQITSSSAGISQYKPENGFTAMGFFGRHMNEYLSFQGSYSWNRNDVALLSASVGADSSLVEQPYRVRLSTLVTEGMLYFRPLRSFARPYLSAGLGTSYLNGDRRNNERAIGNPDSFPAEFSDKGLAFRVAVGIDLRIRGGFAFRYSFSETIQGNGISKQLRPRGERNLANFQNLFGFAWHF